MSAYENEHPKEGAEDQATNLGAADITNLNDDGEKKHPLEARCDILNQIGDQRVPGGGNTTTSTSGTRFHHTASVGC